MFATTWSQGGFSKPETVATIAEALKIDAAEAVRSTQGGVGGESPRKLEVGGGHETHYQTKSHTD